MKKNGSEMTLRELQLFSLEIMKEIHFFCTQNNIQYSLGGGSLIGAVRHKGIIPWDDDIDIFMLRPEYNRFCTLFKSDKYKLKCLENDKNCYINFARVYDDKKTVAETKNPWCKTGSGVWIDVFPLDAVTDDKREWQEQFKKCIVCGDAIINARIARGEFRLRTTMFDKLKLAVRKAFTLNGCLLRYYQKKLNKITPVAEYSSTNHLALMAFPSVRCIKIYVHKKVFTDTILLPFEGCEFCAMNGYDEFLRTQFGDYMQLPPVEKRVPQQSYIKLYWKKI